MGCAATYAKSLEQRWAVQFRTRPPEEERLKGIVLRNCRTFLLLAEYKDFEYNGISLLPKRYIARCRDGAFEHCGNEIIRQNGQHKKARLPQWLQKCDSLPAFFYFAKKHGFWPSVEARASGKSPEAFFIGSIEAVWEKSVDIRCYDAAGEWEDTYIIAYDNIYKISVDSIYGRHFNRYRKKKDRNVS